MASDVVESASSTPSLGKLGNETPVPSRGQDDAGGGEPHPKKPYAFSPRTTGVMVRGGEGFLNYTTFLRKC